MHFTQLPIAQTKKLNALPKLAFLNKHVSEGDKTGSKEAYQLIFTLYL